MKEQSMSAKALFTWIQFGLLAGLLTALLESFFMLDPGISVPPDYPFVLAAFNLLFWTLLYAAAGLLFLTCARTKNRGRHDRVAAGVALALFASAYGFFSKTGLLNYFPDFLTPCADKHISFVWAGCAIAASVYVRKTKNLYALFPLSYAPDIALIAGLFLFCSNTRSPVLYGIGGAAMVAAYLLLLFKRGLFTRRPPVTYALLAVVAFLAATVCYMVNSFNNPLRSHAPAAALQTPAGVPPVILIVLDTLRADRLSLYGGPVPVPHLEQFAADATLFDRCIANSSWTPPAHASLFTGLFPSEHGCVSDTDPGRYPILSGSLKTLAEIFLEQGYQTAGVVANFGYLGPGTNFDQGFQTYDSRQGVGSISTNHSAKPLANLFLGASGLVPKYIIPYAVAEDINAKVMLTLDRISSRPFFLFVNYMDPHSPYYPPLPYARSFTRGPLAVWKRAAVSGTMGKNSAYNDFWLSQYDGEIACLDGQLRKLFAYLKKTGLYDPSLIIVTSDHGEMFGEHGLADHRCELYQEVVHVPLIVKLPQGMQAGRREHRLVTLRDVFYEIVGVCGLLAAEQKPAEDDFDFPAVAEFYDQQFGLQQAFYYQDYKYMSYEKNKGPQLFNLKDDPAEQHNLLAKFPAIRKTMEAGMEQWRGKHTLKIVEEKESATRGQVGEDAVKRLRSLGYIK